VQILRITPGEASPGPGPETTPTEPTPTPTPTPTPPPTPTEEPAPAPTPAPIPTESTKKGGKSGGGKGRPKRLALWAGSHSVKAGDRLAIGGRVIAATPTTSTPVAIQRWQRGWRTVGHARATSDSFFHKRVKLVTHGGGGIARIRVVAPAAIPSRQISVRVLG
jgi:hypothetical protein